MSDAFVTMLVAGGLFAIALAAVRLLRGPSQADRIVALDVVFSANIVLTDGVVHAELGKKGALGTAVSELLKM
jgi:multisubunit Na+/H+ antiporter MnhF subunit